MALSALEEWTVRTDGSDSNGGAFNQHRIAGSNSAFAGLGTDRSLAATAYVTFDGATITASNGSASATITLSGYTVSNADLGNHVNISGGTNFTTGTYEVINVNVGSNTWTLDRSCTSAAGSAMTGAMGGAKLTIAAAVALASANGVIHIKSGTYTLTTAITWANLGMNFIGYNSTHYDWGTKPLITTATNSTKLFAPTGGFGRNYSFHNLSFSNTASIRTCAISSGQGNFQFSSCLFDGFTNGGVDPTSVSSIENQVYLNCEVKNCTGTAGSNTGGIILYPNSSTQIGGVLINCFIHDNAGYGVNIKATICSVVIRGCVITNNGSDGIFCSQSPTVVHLTQNTIANNSGNGVNLGAINASIVTVENNIFYGNTSAGFTWAYTGANGPAILTIVNRNNAYGGNGSEKPSYLPDGTNKITLTSDPFTNAASKDYTLNSSAGGGALLKSVACNWISQTNYRDIGALQSAAAAPAVGTINIQVGDILVAR